MRLRVDKEYPLPLQQQLVAQMRHFIEMGELEPGDALPTIRAAADELGLNPGTVAAAYRELEQEGYVEQRKRAGTKVAASPPRRPERSLAAFLAAECSHRAASAGIDAEMLVQAVAAQALTRAEQPRLRVAVLAGTQLEATRLAQRAAAALPATCDFVSRTPAEYVSSDFHLTVIAPELTARLAPSAPPQQPSRPVGRQYSYGPEFPAGAD